MPYPGFFAYAGTIIANTHQAAAYSADHGMIVRCPGCPLDGPNQTYTTPAADDADWYDPAVPESARMTGVVGLQLTGLGSSTGRREVRPTIGGGGRLGSLFAAHREVRAEVVILGQDQAAISYGLSWLSRAMADPACGAACTGDELEIAAYCPDVVRAGEDPYRTLYDVGVMAGPTELQRGRYGCGWYVRAEIIIASGQPWLYRPVTRTQTTELATGTVVTFDPIINQDICVTPATCFDDPACPPPTPPPVPATIDDPCFVRTAFSARQQLISFPPEQMSGWLETVPIVTVQTADTPVRRLTVRFYQTDIGGCVTPLDPCAYMAEFSIPYIGPNSELQVDGRVRQSYGTCGGDITAEADPKLYGPGGGPFSWPVFACDTGLCVQVVALDGSANATVTVDLSVRQDAA